MIYKLNNVVFDINKEHCIVDTNYPAGFFKEVTNREMIGITEEADPLPPEKTLQQINNDTSNNIQILWQAAHDFEYAEISGMAVGLLVLGVLQSLPKALAVQAWSKSIWALYYSRKPLVIDILNTDLQDFSSIGPIPYSIPELMAELGL